MNAVISGRVGKALLIESDSLRSFSVDDPSTFLPVRPHELHLLFADAPDLKLLENVSVERALRVLEYECKCADALDLALISFDPGLSQAIRKEAVKELEALMSEPDVAGRLVNILYSHPLPLSADMDGALRICDATHALNAQGMLRELRKNQHAIREVCLAWDMTVGNLYGSDAPDDLFQEMVIEKGLFYTTALAFGDARETTSNRHAILDYIDKVIIAYVERNQRENSPNIQQYSSVTPKLKPDSKGYPDSVEAALLNIEKKFGKGNIMRLGERGNTDVQAIPTTSLSLDAAIGVGGVPRGRIVEIYGPESGGKTTLALHIMAEAQKRGGIAAYIDAEHAIDTEYARKLGVIADELLISQPDSGEQALEIAEALLRSNGLDVIVINSVAALIPRAELDGEMGNSLPGLQARLMSQALRKLAAIVSQTNTCLIFINEIQEKAGTMFGSYETYPGGRALKFYSSLRLDVRRVGTIKIRNQIRGNRTKVKVVKNKVAPPFHECEFDIIYDEGISREGDVFDLSLANGIISQGGSWFSYKGTRLGQGRENSKQILRDNPELLRQLENDIRHTLEIYFQDEARPATSDLRQVVMQGSRARKKYEFGN